MNDDKITKLPTPLMQNLIRDMQDAAGQLDVDIGHLSDMWRRHPDIVAKHEKALGETIGRFLLIMEEIAKHNGN